MSIPVSSSGGQEFERIKPDTYVARCYEMIHIGTVPEEYMGQQKMLNKVRISWEMPNELKVFKEGDEAKPLVISKEFTASLGDKANLRAVLKSWRGVDFTPSELEKFELENLVGAPCMITIIDKTNAKGDKTYNDISAITKMPKELKCPPQINKSRILSFDKFDLQFFESLPDFIKNKIKTSIEYKAMMDTKPNEAVPPVEDEDPDGLPF